MCGAAWTWARVTTAGRGERCDVDSEGKVLFTNFQNCGLLSERGYPRAGGIVLVPSGLSSVLASQFLRSVCTRIENHGTRRERVGTIIVAVCKLPVSAETPASSWFCWNHVHVLHPPPEMVDLIIDHLHDQPATFKTCCVVSKSWVPRTRKQLFSHVEFHDSKSPSNYGRGPFRILPTLPLFVDASVVDPGAVNWIRTFHNVEHLNFSDASRAVLVPFYGFSSAVRSLHLTRSTADVFDLICSLPLLEDLTLHLLYHDSDEWNTPSTSPKLTGTLYLRTRSCTCKVIRRLLDLPGGLHFSKVNQ